jgi:putative flavoprotein involved in K+ transport
VPYAHRMAMTGDLTHIPPAYVIGAGPGGLATAAALRQRGLRAVVLEKAPHLGASWRQHYDRLHLHTTRALSGLPGLPIPRRYGRWVGRDDVVRYLEAYAGHHELEIITGVEVTRVDRDPDTGLWRLAATGGRELTGRTVVVATGHNNTPHLPDWPGRDAYTGELLHAAEYRNARPYAGKDVLVIGTGNTGTEISVDLAGSGASGVRISVRSLPHILRRTTAGWPAQRTGILVRRLPVRLVDRLASRVERLGMPDLGAYGLPYPASGLYSRVLEGAIPVQDVGFVKAVRQREVVVVPAVHRFTKDAVTLIDGTELRPDAVIAATGYRRGLERMVGHLGVLTPDGRPRAHGPHTLPEAPRLYFTGFTNPISGMLRELAMDAERIARAASRAGG